MCVCVCVRIYICINEVNADTLDVYIQECMCILHMYTGTCMWTCNLRSIHTGLHIHDIKAVYAYIKAYLCKQVFVQGRVRVVNARARENNREEEEERERAREHREV